MIIVKLMGGLGNQMFQYATAKALALKHGVDVKVDVSYLNENAKGNYTQRNFDLDTFEKPVNIASKDEINTFLRKADNKLSRFIHRKFPFLFSSLRAVESGSPYHSEFEKYPKNTYLEGFWQSELYFKRYETDIRNDFKFKQNIIDKNLQISSLISNTESVSVHVRRGDYIKNAESNKFHGVCSLNYYYKAIEHIANLKPNIELFIFSDDIEWCKNNFSFKYPVHFMETNDAYSDLYLMSKCKHNIIANSSFSWWGAWLNTNSNKIVIAPKQWIANTSVNTKDIIPSSWIKLPN